MKKSCVFIGTIEVAGVASNLAVGLKQIGYDVILTSKFRHPFGYGATLKQHPINVLWQKIGDMRIRLKGRASIMKPLGFLVDKCFALIVLAYALKKCDVFVLNFGSQIVSRKFDLILLKYLNKKIIVIYLGSDSRPPYLDGGRFPGVGRENIPKAETIYKQIKKCKKMISLHEKYADYIINNKHSGHYFKKPFLDYEKVSPAAVIKSGNIHRRLTRNRPLDSNAEFTIVHAPSNPLVKGTATIELIISELRRNGFRVILKKLEGLSNDEVQVHIADCDFVIDQLYSDLQMPVFATEAALQGKPVIIAGYSASLDFKENVNSSEITFFVHPTQIREAVVYFFENPDFRKRISENAQIFASNNQSPAAVARRFELMFLDNVPDDWYCEQCSSTDMNGCGLTEERRTALIEAITSKYGSSIL